MALSSNSLIHLTNIAGFNGILGEGFKVRYCHEIIKIKGRPKPLDILVPTISFFDIPFSQLYKSFENYGKYGIGLKKSWAKKNGLNPVLYIDSDSSIGQSINKQLNNILRTESQISNWTTEQKIVLGVIRYIKNYQYILYRKGTLVNDNYRFSDEREWRYIPHPDFPHQFISNTYGLDYDAISKKKNYYNNKYFEKARLKFDLNDITYIIIKEEAERDACIRLLKKRFPAANGLALAKLYSMIITHEQLITDF